MASMIFDMIILAGGLGSRLRSVVSDVPKPMAPIGGRPFLEYLMDYWIGQGVKRFTLSVGYLGGKIEAHFGNEYRGFPIRYVREDEPMGTGGGLKKVLSSLDWQGEHVVLANGDTWYEVDLKKLTHDSTAMQLPVTIALKPLASNDRYGAVLVNGDNQVTDFGVQSNGACLINGGCYILNVDELRQSMDALPEKFSLEQDLMVHMARDHQVAASRQDVKFLDIGLPEDYSKAANFLVEHQ